MFRNIFSLIVFLIVLIGFEAYVYYGVKSYYSKKKSFGRQFVKVSYFLLLTLSTLSFIIIIFWGSGIKNNVLNFFIAAIFINFTSKLFFVSALLIDDLRRFLIVLKKLLIPKKKGEEKKGISRSDFLTKMGIAVAAVPALSLPLGMIYGPYNYTIHKKKVKFPNLPKSFSGLKIAQLSDIHVGSFYNKEAVNKGIDLLLAQKPDVIFFTGDIVNDRAIEMDDYYDVFSRLNAPLGVYSVLGNHDYGDYHQWETEEAKEENFENVKGIHAKLGWRLLLDEHLYLEKGEDKIAVIGIENWGKGFHQEGDMSKAYAGCDAPFKILLSHDPSHWDEQVRKDFKDVDLTLAGHTHGAQIGIETHGFKWSPIQLRYDKWAGLYQEDNQYLYVNRGFGFLAYPGRLGIWPEVTILELETT
jgi:predicted MPP superfamily phosphohydrolase